jgi:hypothetical protein
MGAGQGDLLVGRAMASKPPIFIIGVPRSGTTLLASLLSAHPDIHAGPETHFFEAYDHSRPPRIDQPHWVERAIDWLESIHHVERSVPRNAGLTRDELRGYLNQITPSHRGMLEALTVLQMRRAGKSRWLEKTPNHAAHAATLRRLFPESIVIRIVRDPRDTILSLLAVPWGPKTVPAAVSMFVDNDQPGEDFARRDRQTLTVRYEDLVTDPTQTLRTIGSFVDEEFDPQLDRRQSAAEVNRTGEPWKTKVAEKIDASRAGSWERMLPTQDQRFIEALLGPAIDRHGYQRKFYPVGTQLRVHPLRGLPTSPRLVQTIQQGTLLPPTEPVVVLAGEPDPQRLLDRPSGSRLKMLAELSLQVVRWQLAGQKVIWWDENTSSSAGKLSRVMRVLLHPYRRTPAA